MDNHINVMTFNLLSWDTGYCGFAEAAVRFPYAIKTIFKYNPDIVGIQEAEDWLRQNQFDWHHKMADVMTTLGNYEYCAIIDDAACKLSRMTIGAGLMIFYKKNRFTLLDRGCVRYEEGPDRYFQWVKLHDNECNKDLVVTNTHFSIDPKPDPTKPDRDHKMGIELRHIEAQHLYDFWAKHVDTHTALFATGDYNHCSTEPAKEALSSGVFQAARYLTEKPDPNEADNYDYIYVNPQTTRVNQFLNIHDTFENDSPIVNGNPLEYRPSDHRPQMCYAVYKD